MLESIADADVLSEAEAAGPGCSIDSDVRPATVRLTYPLLGEVIRAESMRLASTARMHATALAARGATDPRHVVRHAVLILGSDVPPEPQLLLAAAGSGDAPRDLEARQDLAERAVAAGADQSANSCMRWR